MTNAFCLSDVFELTCRKHGENLCEVLLILDRYFSHFPKKLLVERVKEHHKENWASWNVDAGLSLKSRDCFSCRLSFRGQTVK